MISVVGYLILVGDYQVVCSAVFDVCGLGWVFGVLVFRAGLDFLSLMF